jgi:hypothetical protein
MMFRKAFWRAMGWIDDRINHPIETNMPEWYVEHISMPFCDWVSNGIIMSDLPTGLDLLIATAMLRNMIVMIQPVWEFPEMWFDADGNPYEPDKDEKPILTYVMTLEDMVEHDEKGEIIGSPREFACHMRDRTEDEAAENLLAQLREWERVNS